MAITNIVTVEDVFKEYTPQDLYDSIIFSIKGEKKVGKIEWYDPIEDEVVQALSLGGFLVEKASENDYIKYDIMYYISWDVKET